MGYVFEQLHGNTAWAGNTHIDKHTCLRKLARAPVPPALLLLPLVFEILTFSQAALAGSLSLSEASVFAEWHGAQYETFVWVNVCMGVLFKIRILGSN